MSPPHLSLPRAGLYRSPLLNPSAAAARGSGGATTSSAGGGYYASAPPADAPTHRALDTPTHRALGLLDERPRSSRRHYHDHVAPNDAAGLLNARRSKDPVPSVRLQKDQPAHVVVVGEVRACATRSRTQPQGCLCVATQRVG